MDCSAARVQHTTAHVRLCTLPFNDVTDTDSGRGRCAVRPKGLHDFTAYVYKPRPAICSENAGVKQQEETSQYGKPVVYRIDEVDRQGTGKKGNGKKGNLSLLTFVITSYITAAVYNKDSDMYTQALMIRKSGKGIRPTNTDRQ